MTHDFNKPPHTSSSEETTQKKRIPVYILALVGIFFVALLVYMFADIKPGASDAPPGHPNSQAQPAAPSNPPAGGESAAKGGNAAGGANY
ncbi:hypothetical protein BEN74_07420 [Acinetobacter sp. WCHAc010034]|uniref:hypothetical protein n=1 Tax=Acinetobacter sp. WCHAc010034 TaxID=1879049 RepID=UPI00083AF363|nr:hypothetical protein [Acinetobacter sp. WCHAc010034]AYA02693.1 hypothetical protein BEN74_07420 [Acinetobacter sp. WCHAc010034]MBL8322944.1 hypothetical protein [Acinetobacter sp.]